MTAQYTEIVASFAMFEGYTPYGLEVLLEGGSIVELAPGQMLYAEGEPADFVAMVVSGSLELFVMSDGREQRLTTAGPSRLLGELAVLAAAHRAMSARAADVSVVLKWTAPAFRHLLNSDAQLSQRMFRETFRSIVEERESLVSLLAAARRGSST